MSGDTNFTVVVNQSSDQHALFFGASVLEGNQSSSLLWDSNGTDMVSKRPGMINLQLYNLVCLPMVMHIIKRI